MKTCVGIPLLAVALCGVSSATAQPYPRQPVRVVVPYVPGGTVDLVARALAQRLGEQLGQSFVVENKSGASGAIGSDFVARAAPDGYTLLVQSPTLIANPLMVKKPVYDAIADFTPIALLGSVPMVMAAHAGVPADNLAAFVAQARARPSDFSLGTSAIGSPMHLALAAIKHEARLDIPIIAYRGTAAALNDVLGGQTSAVIDAIPSSMPHIASGRLKPLAVTTPQRLSSLPDVPTVAESGFPGFELVTWYGLWGPAGLPEAVVRKLADAATKAMQSRQILDRLAPQGFVPASEGPQAFSRYIAKERETYARIVRDARIQVE